MKKGFTLVEIMIVVAIIALLVAIAIPNIAAQRRTANNTAAAGTLRSISTALETYNTATNSYPNNITLLTSGNPPYISTFPNGNNIGGYNWSNTLQSVGYTVVACPNSTNSGIYCWRVTTGGAMERCATASTTCSSYTTVY